MAYDIEIHQYYQTKPWVAQITGADEKFGLARAFVRADERDMSRSGRAGDISWSLNEPGLYQIGGSKHDNYKLFMLFSKNGDLVRLNVDLARAKAIAKRLDSGESFEEARLATKPASATPVQAPPADPS
jgi:hypothetical protein